MKLDEDVDYLSHLMAEIHELNRNIIELAFQLSRFKKWVADMDYRIRWIQQKLDGGPPLSRPQDTPDPAKHGDPPIKRT